MQWQAGVTSSNMIDKNGPLPRSVCSEIVQSNFCTSPMRQKSFVVMIPKKSFIRFSSCRSSAGMPV